MTDPSTRLPDTVILCRFWVRAPLAAEASGSPALQENSFCAPMRSRGPRGEEGGGRKDCSPHPIACSCSGGFPKAVSTSPGPCGVTWRSDSPGEPGGTPKSLGWLRQAGACQGRASNVLVFSWCFSLLCLLFKYRSLKNIYLNVKAGFISKVKVHAGRKTFPFSQKPQPRHSQDPLALLQVCS